MPLTISLAIIDTWSSSFDAPQHREVIAGAPNTQGPPAVRALRARPLRHWLSTNLSRILHTAFFFLSKNAAHPLI